MRAIELGIGANNILDRDMRRLLNTLDIGARRFHKEALDPQNSEADADVALSAKVLTWNAGVMIRYLVEVGLGVRYSPTDKVDWYRESGVRLAILQRKFAQELALAPLQREVKSLEEELAKANSSELEKRRKELEKKSKELARAKVLPTGAAAGVLLVAASLVTARGRQDGGAAHEVPCAIVEAAGGPLDLTEPKKVVELAFGPVFQPAERSIVEQFELPLRLPLLAELSADQCRIPSLHQQGDVGRHRINRCPCQDGILAWLLGRAGRRTCGHLC